MTRESRPSGFCLPQPALQVYSKALIVRQLAEIGRPVHENSSATIFASTPASYVTAEELVAALTSAGVAQCLLCLYGQKAPLVRYLAMLMAIHADGDNEIELDVAINTVYASDAAPLVSVVRAPEPGKSSVPQTDACWVQPGRVVQIKGLHGDVGKCHACRLPESIPPQG